MGFLQGKLRVKVEGCDGLLNLCYSRGQKCKSNPYCRVFCYPRSPQETDPLCPSAWRSPMIVGAVAPRWRCAEHDFDFMWKSTQDRSEGTFAGPNKSSAKRGEISRL